LPLLVVSCWKSDTLIAEQIDCADQPRGACCMKMRAVGGAPAPAHEFGQT
jgi:hypothetical protein